MSDNSARPIPAGARQERGNGKRPTDKTSRLPGALRSLWTHHIYRTAGRVSIHNTGKCTRADGQPVSSTSLRRNVGELRQTRYTHRARSSPANRENGVARSLALVRSSNTSSYADVYRWQLAPFHDARTLVTNARENQNTVPCWIVITFENKEYHLFRIW